MARALEDQAAIDRVVPSPDFEDRVMAAIAMEAPARLVVTPGRAMRGGLLAGFLVSLRDAWRVAAAPGRPFAVRAQALAFVLVAAVALGSMTAVVGVGAAAFLSSTPGPTPTPVVTPVPTPMPTPSPDRVTVTELHGDGRTDRNGRPHGDRRTDRDRGPERDGPSNAEADEDPASDGDAGTDRHARTDRDRRRQRRWWRRQWRRREGPRLTTRAR